MFGTDQTTTTQVSSIPLSTMLQPNTKIVIIWRPLLTPGKDMRTIAKAVLTILRNAISVFEGMQELKFDD